jgi:NDP-sugar pyrophosphorylase family protein
VEKRPKRRSTFASRKKFRNTMKAFILAAGYGTRLKPLTNTKPKALVEVGGVPLLEIIIRRLKYFGFTELVINIHHFGDQILDFLENNNNFGVHIDVSDERDQLLDTGGGIKKASVFFQNEPVLIHNVDVLTMLDIRAMLQFHKHQEDALVTLAVKDRETSRSFLLDTNNNLAGWRNNLTGETRISHDDGFGFTPIAFSCVAVINPLFINLLDEEGAFSVIDPYLRLAKTHRIATFRHCDLWMDMGRVEHLKEAEPFLPQLLKF